MSRKRPIFVTVYYLNDKKAAALLQSAGRQLPRGLFRNNGFINSIRDKGSNVKLKFENITETQQFVRWFGDWKKKSNTASKVVNADGTPKVVYHKTGSDFSVFNTKSTRAGRMDNITAAMSPDCDGYKSCRSAGAIDTVKTELRGMGYAEDKISSELTAGLAPEFMNNRALINRLAKSKPDFADKVHDVISDAKAKIYDMQGKKYTASNGVELTYEQLNQAERLWTDAVRAAGANAVANAGNDAEGIAYKRKKQGYDYTKSFSDQVDDWINGNIPQRDSLVVGGTPEIWQKIGFNPLPVTINQTHMDYAINGTKDLDHHIGAALLKQLPQKLKDPVAIIESQTHGNSSVVALIDMKHNGKNVITPVEIDGYGRQNNIRIDSNAATSIHARGNAVTKLLKDAIAKEMNGNIAVYYLNYKKTVALLQRAGLQLPGGLFRNNGFINSIRDKGSKVKPKFENVTETKQFADWFGDWKKKPNAASKVVNADGTPKVVYHQTGSNFSVFNTKSTGAGQTDNIMPNGSFFKSTDSDIGLSGKKQMPVYLNITSF